ncbi:hypothetical protein JCM8547_002831, partial [Rhodosporidiobolus lusitaniae]
NGGLGPFPGVVVLEDGIDDSRTGISPSDGSEEETTPPKKKQKSTKYDKTGKKNFETDISEMAGELVGALGGTGGSDSEEGDLDNGKFPDSGCASSHSPSPGKPSSSRSHFASTFATLTAGSPHPSTSSSAKPTKKKASSTSASSSSKKPPAPKLDEKKLKAKKDKIRPEKKEAKEAQMKSAKFVDEEDDSSPEEEKEKKLRKKTEPAVKEGNEPKGTDEVEKRIKSLKSLLKAANAPSAFSASTGAERTLAVARRTELLEKRLKEVGLVVGEDGRLPSLKKAEEVAKERALAREMKDLSRNPLTSGLRNGKHLPYDSSTDSDEGLDDFEYPKKQTIKAREGFGAFLGDQSSELD